jgi:cobyrinic acid a,c-diamide synthase
VDLEGLLALAESAPGVPFAAPALPPGGEPVRLGVARDKAFCFYYEDSLDVLKDMGAQLVPFSPLEDAALPEGLQGLYLGGGYPELYAALLSRNESMRASVRAALEGGLPCIAECGGFMYLTQAVAGEKMVGFLPGECQDQKKLTRFGYITLRAGEDNLLCKAGEAIPGHEFHHWDCTQPGEKFTAEKPAGRKWACAQASGRLYAGFPHFHFLANPAFAVNFYNACLEVKRAHG